MTNALRDRCADALLRRLEAHEGPVADAERYMERLDVLTGVDLAQKQLAPVETPTPWFEGSTPAEHGSGLADAGVSPVKVATTLGEPDPLPAVHEATQETPVSASPGTAQPAEATSPASSPTCVACGKPKKSTKGTMCKSCSNKSRTGSKSVFNRSITPSPRHALEEPQNALDVHQNFEPERQNLAPEANDVPPARGLAAVTANPPVEAPAPTKNVCACPDWWRTETAGWREDIPNEGHHEACARYRKGGHKWPLPSRKGDEVGPFVIQCGWCTDTREVDLHGVEWRLSERNPANAGKVLA